MTTTISTIAYATEGAPGAFDTYFEARSGTYWMNSAPATIPQIDPRPEITAPITR